MGGDTEGGKMNSEGSDTSNSTIPHRAVSDYKSKLTRNSERRAPKLVCGLLKHVAVICPVYFFF